MKFYTNIKLSGNRLLYVGYENNNKIIKAIPFSPVLFIKTHKEDSKFTSIDDDKLEPIKFEDIKEARDFIKKYEGMSGFQIFGNDRFNYEYIARNFKGEIKYSFSDIRTFYLDIEVHSEEGFPHAHAANHKITAITIFDTKTQKYYVWCEKNSPGGKFSTNRLDVVTNEFENEIDLLYSFLQFWENNYPDIVSGWNSRAFDIPYIINRIKKLLGDYIVNKLSPFQMVNEKKVTVKRFSKFEEVQTYEIVGVNEIDYLDIYKKYASNKESYKLGFIGEVELGETKVDFDGPLSTLYKTDYQTYIEYNLQDVALLVKLENKLKYLELLVEVSYTGKVASFNDALGTIKFWEVLIYNHLYEKNIIAPLKKHSNSDKDEQYAGAFVKEPRPGLYKWIISYDVASLYPSTIRQINIGPETLVPVQSLPNELKVLLSKITPQKLIDKSIDLSLLKKYDLSLAANGKLYHKHKQSFLSEIMESLFEKRKQYKKKMSNAKKAYELHHKDEDAILKEVYGIKQQAYKIILNSGYGAVGNQHFQYFSVDNAEAITLSGQVAIQWLEKRINSYINNILKTDEDYAIAMDTDSVYLDVTTLVENLYQGKEKDKAKIVECLDKISKSKIEPYIEKCIEEFFNYFNNKNNNIEMVRDVIATNAVWRAKKNYFMDVWDSEGVRYSEPQLKIMGIEVVKSSTPKVCREAIKDCLRIITRDEDEEKLQTYVKNFKAKYYTLSPYDIANPKGINNISEYSTKDNILIPRAACPQHIRASVNYNRCLEEYNVSNVYERIWDGSKIKLLYLKMPNPIKDEVIAFGDKFPKEFKLESYIDYNKQFEKTFLSPLQSITDVIGWETSKIQRLDMFG